MRNRLCLGVTALAFGLAGNASAGVVVTSTQTKLDSHETNPTTVYAETDRLKVVTPDNIVIFRGDLNRLWIIDPQRQSYMEMTPETMQRMGGQMAGAASQLDAAQAQLQARMAQMPPEQRAMMEQMLAQRGIGGAAGGRGGPPAPPQISYSKSGGGKSVGSWRCDLYKKTVNGQQEEDICIAPAASTGLAASDFAVMDRLSAFVAPVTSSPMMPRADYMNWNAMNKAIGFQGMPLDTTVYSQGRPSTQSTVNKIERTGIAANTFDLPQGLTKREIGVPPPR